MTDEGIYYICATVAGVAGMAAFCFFMWLLLK